MFRWRLCVLIPEGELVIFLTLTMLYGQLVGVEDLPIQRLPRLFGDREEHRAGQFSAFLDVVLLGLLDEKAVPGVEDAEPPNGKGPGDVDVRRGLEFAVGVPNREYEKFCE